MEFDLIFDENNQYRVELPLLLNKIEDLIFQKNFLKKEIKVINNQYQNT